MQHAVHLWHCLPSAIIQKRRKGLEKRLQKYLDTS